MYTPDILGQRIKKARTLAHLSQGELAKKLQITGNMTISRYENGLRYPDLDTLIRISHATECPLAWFFAADDGEPVRQSEERELLELFGSLSSDGRRHILECLHNAVAAEQQRS